MLVHKFRVSRCVAQQIASRRAVVSARTLNPELGFVGMKEVEVMPHLMGKCLDAVRVRTDSIHAVDIQQHSLTVLPCKASPAANVSQLGEVNVDRVQDDIDQQ